MILIAITIFLTKLPEKYLCKGSPNKLMLEGLKELNIHDIQDSLNKAKPTDKPFKKDTHTVPAQYHLESSCGTVKDRLSVYQLKLYFGGKKLKYFCVLSSLRDGLTIVDNNHNVPIVSELVNPKQGKHQQKGSKATVPLKVVGMNIGYGNGDAVGGYKYVLILFDQCTTNSCLYGMHGCSGSDVYKEHWKLFIDAGGFSCTIQCDFDPQLIDGKAAQLLCSHGT